MDAHGIDVSVRRDRLTSFNCRSLLSVFPADCLSREPLARLSQPSGSCRSSARTERRPPKLLLHLLAVLVRTKAHDRSHPKTTFRIWLVATRS